MKKYFNLALICSVLFLGLAAVSKFQSISKDKNLFVERQTIILANSGF